MEGWAANRTPHTTHDTGGEVLPVSITIPAPVRFAKWLVVEVVVVLLLLLLLLLCTLKRSRHTIHDTAGKVLPALR